MIRQLQSIPEGTEGDSSYEVWCHKAIRICFAKSLKNVELKPNKQARQRRDIVATNLADSGAWKRIYEDYRCRQVIFEVKNYKNLQASDYQQLVSYTGGEYGKLAFLVTREDSVDLFANRDVDWVREIHSLHKVLVIKLTGKFLARLLYKLRNPRKHDAINDAINRLLDTYTRLYLAGQTATEARQEKRNARKQDRARKKSLRPTKGERNATIVAPR